MEIKQDINIYLDTFAEISSLIVDIGINKECGLTSKLCASSKQFEKSLKDKNLLEQSILHLKLRRAEKDFFLRSDIKYFELHKSLVKELLSYEMSTEDRAIFNDYNYAFLEIVKKLQKIGLNEELSMKGKMRNSVHKIEYFMYEKNSFVIGYVKTKIKELQETQYIVYISILMMFVFMFFVLLKPIFKAIYLFKNFFKSFSNTSQRLDSSKFNLTELQDMATVVNHMLYERQIVEKELVDSRDEAIHLQKVKEQFLSNMSHELRTPLNAIIGFSGILQNKIPKEKKLVDPIVKSSKHLLKIVNDILDLSKIQSGKFTINHAAFKPFNELDRCINLFETQITGKNIEFTTNINIEKNLSLYGDWLRITQILNNLLSNAIKFTPKNGKIDFDVSYQNHILKMSVKDDGIGMSQEVQRRILEPFEQADSSTTKKFGGTGLGLSISTTLAHIMNGEIIIQSSEGKGSVFTLELPLYESCEIEEVSEHKSEIDEKLLGHVLIAEDNKTNQLLLGLMLDDIGLTYDIANDGVEAVAMYGKKKYDLVLMDENMPNLNGIEAMKEIRKRYVNVVPIIAVTANVMSGDEQHFFEAGMDDFIPKPVDNIVLINKITKHLH